MTTISPEEIAGIADLALGAWRSDGDRLCAWGHEIPEGEPLYWPANPSSQYDDSDPHCLNHAIERAQGRGYIDRKEAAALRAHLAAHLEKGNG